MIGIVESGMRSRGGGERAATVTLTMANATAQEGPIVRLLPPETQPGDSHEPEKTEPGVSSGDITNAEGETDIDATFSIVVQ